MRNSWIFWTLTVGIIIAVLIAFNYQKHNENIPLSEIFPEDTENPVAVEYEFVNKETAPAAQDMPKSADVQPNAVTIAVPPKPAVAPASAPQSAPRVQAVKTGNFPYRIQVASSKDKKKAEEMVVRLKSKNTEAKIVEKNLGDKGTWYRVYAGQFSTKKEAEDFLPKIKADFPESFVISSQ